MKNLTTTLVVTLTLVFAVGCGYNFEDDKARKKAPTSSSGGVKKVTVNVPTNEKGITVEQANIATRLRKDNTIGSVKHLYLISAMTGDVIMYSTVRGKVTSSGKRLTPYSVSSGSHAYGTTNHVLRHGIPVSIGGKTHYTSEVLQDDGTYGHSVPYIYWWDTNGVYRQAYVVGGVLPIVSEAPMNFPKVILNFDSSWTPEPSESEKVAPVKVLKPASKLSQ